MDWEMLGEEDHFLVTKSIDRKLQLLILILFEQASAYRQEEYRFPASREMLTREQ